jgi:sugar phosphate isomerase/epimerase
MPRLTSRRDLLLSGAAFASAAALPAVRSSACINPIERAGGGAKIKLSCAAYSFRDQLTGKKQPAWTLDQFIDFCAENGLEGTELTGYYFPKEITPEYLAHLKHKTFLLGLDVSGTAINNNFCLPAGSQRDEQIAHVKQWIDYADGFGAPCIRIFSGAVPKGHTEQEARAWCVECIEECCRYAGEKGIFLALENHGGISTSAEGLLAVVRAVRSPWFGVNLDTGNFRSADPYEELAQAAPYAITVQVKTEVTPAGKKKEDADLKRVIGILRDAHYRGYVALEYEAEEDAQTAVPRHLRRLRELIG